MEITHLAWSTQRENVLDIYARELKSRCFKLDEVRDIKRRLAAGEMGKDIAEDYGVDQTAISKIRRGRRWQWVTDWEDRT